MYLYKFLRRIHFLNILFITFDKSNIIPAVTFLHPNYNLLLYDHRYFGESSGRITTAGLREVEDVKAALRYVKKKYDLPIAFYGFSLSASAMLMADEDVNVIIVEAPYADLERMIKRTYSIFGPLKFPFVMTTNMLAKLFFGVHPRDVSPQNAVKDSKIPILLIHGEKDSQISVENAYAIKESNPSIDLWIVKNADHGEAQLSSDYERRVKAFLRKHMK